MDFVTFVLYLLVILILSIAFQRLYDKYQKRPPGPIGLPFFGRIPFIIYNTIFKNHGNALDAISTDGASYGDMRFLRAGMRHFLILSSYEIVNDALSRPEFSQRPNDYCDLYRKVKLNANGEKKEVGGGILTSNDLIWQVHRRFALRVLRDFGMGKNLIEIKIQLEAQNLIEKLTKSSGQPLNPSIHLTKAVSNIICQLVFGYRFGYEDPEFAKQIRLIKEIAQSFGIGLFIPMFFPLFDKEAFFRIIGSSEMLTAEKSLLDYVESKVNDVASHYNADDPPTNYIESYLSYVAECKEQKKNGNSYDYTFSQYQLNLVVTDLFIAGTDTTSNSLNWAFINMAIYPEWQQKVHEELDRELGSCSDVALADRIRCPITLAVLDESMRFCSIVPHNVHREIKEEFRFRGKLISPKTYVFADIKSVHNDPNIWTDPRSFLPTRFLSDDGQYRPSKYLIGFSIGKRSCLGESLARAEYFMFFASIMLRFQVELDEETKRKGSDIYHGTDGVIFAPKEHKLIFRERCME